MSTPPDRLPRPAAHPDPGPGRESVWDYPRPPRLEPSTKRITVELGGVMIADTTRAMRVLETSHPPVYYIPLADVVAGVLTPSRAGESWCEWKGSAAYYDVAAGGRQAPRGAWTYRTPSASYAAIRDAVAFYPSAMDRCTVDGVVVTPQPGDFYGGWITPDIVGPFKGAPGTRGW